MKRIALHLRARDGGVDEPQIEGGVVANQDRTAAAIATHRMANLPEDSLQGVTFGQRRTQRVKGVDAGDRQGRGIEPSALEGLDVEVMGGTAFQQPLAVHVDEHRGDLEQRVGGGMKAAGFHVDGHRQVTAEAPRHERRRRGWRRESLRRCLAHGAAPTPEGARRQAMRSELRSGTSSSVPNG